MFYTEELQALFDINDISDLKLRLTAIQKVMGHDIQLFTNIELMKLLNDLLKLKPIVSGHAVYERQLDAFINQIKGNKKLDFRDHCLVYPYQLLVDDLVVISEHYHRRGIRIFIENRLTDIPKKQFFSESVYQSFNLIQANAIDEMLSIQQTLKEGEYVGYIYTNNVAAGHSEHFEAFIIGQKLIIKPVTWPLLFGCTLELDSYGIDKAITNLYEFCDQESQAQAGIHECGALSLSYLKNYLKDSARLLHEFTLSVPYYAYSNTKPSYFHFPAPHVLRYSQSNNYNRCFEAMLKPDGDRWVHGGKEQSIKSLQQLLEETLAKATVYNDIETISQIQCILEQLPAFSERWLNAYQDVMHKSQSMQTETGNRYLGYTLQRMRCIADMAKQAVTNPGLSLLSRLDALLASSIQPADIILVLKKELTTIPFKTVDEIGYFFGKLPNTYYLEILDELAMMVEHDVTDFYLCTSFLSPVKILLLINHIKKPENFYRILVSRNNKSLGNLLDWLNNLRIPKEERSLFLSDRLEKSWLSQKVKLFVLDGCLPSLSAIFPGEMEFSRFLRTYISQLDIIELMPELFLKSDLLRITSWFETRKTFQDFVRKNLSIDFIQRTLLSKESCHATYKIAKSYIDLFDKEEASTILFHAIGPAVLDHFLREPCTLYNNYSPCQKFLADVLTCLPLQDRWTFIDRVFSLADIEKLLQIKYIAKNLPERILPKEIELGSSHVPEAPDPTLAVVSGSLSEGIDMTVGAIAVGVGSKAAGFFGSSELKPGDSLQIHSQKNRTI